VIPAAIIVLVTGILFIPFLRALSPITRLRFVIAGVIYVGGALGMEIPLGAWTAHYGDDNLGYALIDFVEETMEIFGASFFLLAILDHRARLEAP
jgi:hypothetical protein